MQKYWSFVWAKKWKQVEEVMRFISIAWNKDIMINVSRNNVVYHINSTVVYEIYRWGIEGVQPISVNML